MENESFFSFREQARAVSVRRLKRIPEFHDLPVGLATDLWITFIAGEGPGDMGCRTRNIEAVADQVLTRACRGLLSGTGGWRVLGVKRQGVIVRTHFRRNARRPATGNVSQLSASVNPVSSPGSVTTWIAELRTGNQEAAQQLWERYFHRLVGLARAKLKGTARRAADEEDVALSAFNSFYQGAVQGRFPNLRDRNNLWPLLVVITVRKAIDLVQHNVTQKEGGGHLQGESALLFLEDSSTIGAGIEQVVGREPTPEFAAEVVEECQRLLGQLVEDRLRDIALLKMDGYTDKEVATRLGCGLRTVERKLERIRVIWGKGIMR